MLEPRILLEDPGKSYHAKHRVKGGNPQITQISTDSKSNAEARIDSGVNLRESAKSADKIILSGIGSQRVEAIVEAFSSMQEDLDKERKAIMKQWAKREEQIERVRGATVGMYGDLQGIAGKSLQEIEGLELPVLGSDAAGENK